jgi:hypothetical protein
MTVDVCSCNNWPERFTRADLQQRRKETRTLNAWDSQYMLEAKPVGEVRLDPARIVPYDVEPRFAWSNRVFTMWLGSVRIVGAVLRWDPSSGKKHSDKSGYVLDLSDDIGRHYWHRAGAVAGEIAITSDDGKDIVGGQVIELCDLIEKHRVPVVVVETNGIGDGAIRLLRMAVKQRRIACAVRGTNATANKNKRILEALQPLLDTRMLWAHVSVLDEGPLWDEMQSWNPAVPEQPDDILDAGSGAVTDQPGRIGAGVRNREAPQADDWRPSSRTTTYELVPAD